MKHFIACMLVLFATSLTACRQPPVDSPEAVRDAVKSYVKAINKGDAEKFRDSHSASQRQQFDDAFVKAGFPARKDFDIQVAEVLLRKRTAAAFGRVLENGKPGDDEMALLFVRENDRWKLERQLGSNTPIHRSSFAPPDEGRFITGGMPWKDIPAQNMHIGDTPQGYALQAAIDESFLYLRLGFATPLQPQDSPLPDAGPDRMPRLPDIQPRTLRIAGKGMAPFDVIFDTTVITHFRNGRNSYALGYNFALMDKDGKTLFNTHASSEEGLIVVGKSDIVVRIPLESMNAGAAQDVSLARPGMDPGTPLIPKRF